MATKNQKIIVVIGATGNQGGSVARQFLKLREWKVRAITRNPSSPTAKDLVASGAEVIQADLTDIDSLTTAFQNANAIFLNTNFWEIYRPLFAKITADGGKLEEEELGLSETVFQTEVANGKNAVLAASKVPTLENFVYSALLSMKEITGGNYSSLHWESKAAITEYIEKEHLELAKKTSFIYLGAYNTNRFLSPTFDPTDGKYKFITALDGDSKMPVFDPIKTTGPLVRALIEDEEPGIKLLAYDTDSYLSMEKIYGIRSKATGKEFSQVGVTVEKLHQMTGVPMEILAAIPALKEFGYTGGIKMMEPGDLKYKVNSKSYEEWMMGRDWEDILRNDDQLGQKNV